MNVGRGDGRTDGKSRAITKLRKKKQGKRWLLVVFILATAALAWRKAEEWPLGRQDHFTAAIRKF